MLDNLNRLLLPVYQLHFRFQSGDQIWTHLRWEKLKSTKKANNYCMLNSKFRHILILLFDSPSSVQNLSLYKAFSWLADQNLFHSMTANQAEASFWKPSFSHDCIMLCKEFWKRSRHVGWRCLRCSGHEPNNWILANDC